jgi:D-glycero-D-manno-heptose 1,7-bisphosphate phosphatase
MQEIGVFIDRDGTLTEEVGYINHPSRLRLYPWSAQAIKALNQNDLRTIVVTNQAGIARGYFTEDLVTQVHEKLRAEMSREGARIDAIYYCPHHPSVGEAPYRQDCNCRKPKPGMLHRAVQDLGVDLSRSFVIGDRYGDVELAHNAGVRSIFVLSGYGLGEYEYQRQNWRVQPDWIAQNLLEATEIIFREVAKWTRWDFQGND